MYPNKFTIVKWDLIFSDFFGNTSPDKLFHIEHRNFERRKLERRKPLRRFPPRLLGRVDRQQHHEPDRPPLLSGIRHPKEPEASFPFRNENFRSTLFDGIVFTIFRRSRVRFSGIGKSEIIRNIRNRNLQRIVSSECDGPVGDHGPAGILSFGVDRDQARLQFCLQRSR